MEAGIAKSRRMGASLHQSHSEGRYLMWRAALRPAHGELRARPMIGAEQAQPHRIAMKASAGIIIHASQIGPDFRLLRDGGKKAPQQQQVRKQRRRGRHGQFLHNLVQGIFGAAATNGAKGHLRIKISR